MSDMLIKQLKGRYHECKLSCQTYVDPRLIGNSIADVDKLVKRQMVEQIATAIINKPDYVTWKVGPPEHDFIGNRYQIHTYLLDEYTMNKLIQDAFAAGVESIVKV